MNNIILTTSWDDGHVLDIKLAGLLRKYNLPGTFYIAPADHEIAAVNRLNQKQIINLSKDFEIGAHTMTHPKLSEIDDMLAQREIVSSKKILEGMICREVKSFCYPSGDYKPRHKQMVKDAGFLLARTVNRFSSEIGSDLYELPTTIHGYLHWSDVFPIFQEVGIKDFVKDYLNWDRLAIAMFEKIQLCGGVFHIWGHSWEIEKNNDWNRLERVFAHIAYKAGVRYLTNGELISL